MSTRHIVEPCCRAICIAVCAAIVSPALVAEAATLGEAMRLLPSDAVGAIVVPDLKRTNDELALCLERMDRPEAFFVGRPIDLAKARFGMSVGVRDHGALVAALRWPETSDMPLPLLFVPVNDADAFMAGNFVRGDDGSMVDARGNPVHAVDLGRWVALAPEASALVGVRVAAAEDSTALDRLHERLGGRATALLAGEILAWIDGSALRRLDERGELGELGELDLTFARLEFPLPLGALSASAPLAGLDIAAMSIDIDALGVMAHGALRYDADSAIGSALRRPERAARSLSRLPDTVPYWAMSVDVAAMRPFMSIVAPEGSMNDRTRALLDGITAIQWGCWPSRLGVAVGGLLNDSSLLIESTDPDALRLGILDLLVATAGERDGVLIDPQIERERALRSGGSADAFEVRETPLPDADPTAAAIRNGVRSALFGNRGVHGFLRTVPDGVVVTFSQRPDVLNRAVEAGVSAPALDGSATVAAMREFMVDRPTAEGYLGVGELARVVRQLAGAFGAGGAVPQINAGTEPIGFAISIDDATLLGSTVVPAGVLGAMLDQARRMR